MSVPKPMRDKYEEIAPLISEFCREQLSEDYETLCLRLLEKLCRKRPSPLSGSRANTWAAGLIYAIASNNDIFDRSQPIHKTAEELSAPFGLAKSTVANKAAEIARLCGVSRYDAQWLLPEIVDSSPLVWFVEADGYLMDMRRAPVGLQIAAYERGFIPYVPALRQEEKKREAKEPDPQPAPRRRKKPRTPCPRSPPLPNRQTIRIFTAPLGRRDWMTKIAGDQSDIERPRLSRLKRDRRGRYCWLIVELSLSQPSTLLRAITNPVFTPTGRAARVCRPYEAASASSVPMRPAPERLILHGHTSLVQKAFTRRAGALGISCAVREALVLASRAWCVRRLRPRCARDTTVRARYNGARAIQPSALLA